MYTTHKFFLLIFSLFLLTACGRSTTPPTPAPTETQAAVVVPTETPNPTSTPEPTATPLSTEAPEEVTQSDAATEVDETSEVDAADEAVDPEEEATDDGATDDTAENNDVAVEDVTDDEAADADEATEVAEEEGEDAAIADAPIDEIADAEMANAEENAGDTAESNEATVDEPADDEAADANKAADPEEDSASSDEVVEEAATAETDAPYMGRPPEELWASLACSACHQLDQDQTESNRGPVGPHQGNLAERIATIAPDQEPEEYVYTSIVDPNAYVVETYFPDIMPQTYGEQMSEEEIRALARWMLNPNR